MGWISFGIGTAFRGARYTRKAIRYSTRGSRRSYSTRPKAPAYNHGHCTINHRTPGAAQRCSQTAAYRRAEAAAIVEQLYDTPVHPRVQEEEAAIGRAAQWASGQPLQPFQQPSRRKRNTWWWQG